ncbi:MAG: hypothetical protein ACR2OI_06110, partial [Acidimicrobiia bacterium]
LELFSLEVGRTDVEVVVVGAERPDDADDLAAELEAELGRDLVVTLRWVPEEQFVVDGKQ